MPVAFIPENGAFAVKFMRQFWMAVHRSEDLAPGVAKPKASDQSTGAKLSEAMVWTATLSNGTPSPAIRRPPGPRPRLGTSR